MALVLLSLALGLLSSSCSQELFDNESDLVVLNDSSCVVKVIVDGREAFSVKSGSDRILDDVGEGRHVLEAVDASNRVVERRTIELSHGEDFFWTLERCQP